MSVLLAKGSSTVSRPYGDAGAQEHWSEHGIARWGFSSGCWCGNQPPSSTPYSKTL